MNKELTSDHVSMNKGSHKTRFLTLSLAKRSGIKCVSYILRANGFLFCSVPVPSYSITCNHDNNHDNNYDNNHDGSNDMIILS